MNNNNQNMSKIEGRNPVIEALKSKRAIDKIYVKKGEVQGSLKKIFALARAQKIIICEVEKSKLDQMSETNAHQGVIAVAPVKDYVK